VKVEPSRLVPRKNAANLELENKFDLINISKFSKYIHFQLQSAWRHRHVVVCMSVAYIVVTVKTASGARCDCAQPSVFLP